MRGRNGYYPILVSAAALSAAAVPANAATSNFGLFEFIGQSQFASATPPTNIRISFDALATPSSGLSGTFTTPNGLSSGSYNSSEGLGNSETYASAPALAAETSPWTLTGTIGSNTSQYDLYPAFGSLGQSFFPTITIAGPVSGSTVSNRYTPVSWTETGNVGTAQVQLLDSALNINALYNISAGATAWYPPAALANGTYTVHVFLDSPTITLADQPTLLSGPDIGVPTNFSFSDSAFGQTSFTVVPEPGSVAAIVLMAAAVSARRRRS